MYRNLFDRCMAEVMHVSSGANVVVGHGKLTRHVWQYSMLLPWTDIQSLLTFARICVVGRSC
jgi:hypothetical protein